MMLTAKPISTISYNTTFFAFDVLDKLFKSGRIDDYRYICHEGENGDKDHMHIIIYPNRRLDTVELRNLFIEPIADGDPLGCMPFRSSKVDHWLMYALHDPLYLRNHEDIEQSDGKREYTLDDVITPFRPQLERDYNSAKLLRRTTNQIIVEAFASGSSATEIIYRENVRPNDVVSIGQAMDRDTTSVLDKKSRSEMVDYIKSLCESSSNGTCSVITELSPIGGIPQIQYDTYEFDFVTGELKRLDSQIKSC